jgi:L-ascorbate metabolism protein UlaG (beta-lactamase superfamily)
LNVKRVLPIANNQTFRIIPFLPKSFKNKLARNPT